MALRDIVKVGSRVLGAGIGTLIAPGVGTMAGYGIGATVGDIVGGSPEDKMVQTAEVGAYDPTSGFQTDLKSRVSKGESLVSQPGWSDKITAVTDPMVAAASNLYGLTGGGATAAGEGGKSIGGTVARKAKIGVAGSTATDLSDIKGLLGETEDLIGIGSRMTGNINQRRVAAGLLPLKATQTGQVINPNTLMDIGGYPTSMSELQQYLNQ